MNSIILDTNVLIYGLDTNSGFHRSAVEVLTDPQLIFFVPTKVISEFFAVTSKLDLSHEVSFSFLEELKNNATVLYPNQVSLTHFEQLIKKYNPRGNRVFDMEIVSIALANNISGIATANLSDFQGISEIKILPVTLKG